MLAKPEPGLAVLHPGHRPPLPPDAHPHAVQTQPSPRQNLQLICKFTKSFHVLSMSFPPKETQKETAKEGTPGEGGQRRPVTG